MGLKASPDFWAVRILPKCLEAMFRNIRIPVSFDDVYCSLICRVFPSLLLVYVYSFCLVVYGNPGIKDLGDRKVLRFVYVGVSVVMVSQV